MDHLQALIGAKVIEAKISNFFPADLIKSPAETTARLQSIEIELNSLLTRQIPVTVALGLQQKLAEKHLFADIVIKLCQNSNVHFAYLFSSVLSFKQK